MFPESRKQRTEYYQGLADALGLPLDGKLSVTATRALPGATASPAPNPVPKPAPSVARPEPLPAPNTGDYKWSVCLHESGHIVGALATGGRVVRGVVTRRDGYAESFGTGSVHDRATVIYCGPLAQLLFGDGDCPFANGDAAGDMENLFALNLRAAARADARAEAERLVSLHRTAIGRIANVLAARGFIDGPEAEAVYRASL